MPSAQLVVLADADAAAAAAARRAAELLQAAIAQRGRATLAVSGGQTPARMLELLAEAPIDWQRLDVFQVDERVAPDGHADRNATRQAAALPVADFHAMPVTAADLAAAAADYAAELQRYAGHPIHLDIVHLGLGPDGHIASIFPGAGVADDRDVAVVGPHLGRLRMTLTLAAINRARHILWLVTGQAKRAALAAMLAGDPVCVGSRVRHDAAVVFADREAAVDIPHS
jgi:6-phosphogluconolactonase